MKQINYPAINLTYALQKGSELQPDECRNGVISRTSKGFLFQEAISRRTCRRNAKLYDGKYVSMVRKQNGRYQCHLKTFEPTVHQDPHELAYQIYAELIEAMEIVN